MGLYKIFEPIDLFLVNGDFVRGVDGVTEDGGSETDKKSFVGNLTAEVGCFFVVGSEVHFEVFLVGFELSEGRKRRLKQVRIRREKQ